MKALALQAVIVLLLLFSVSSAPSSRDTRRHTRVQPRGDARNPERAPKRDERETLGDDNRRGKQKRPSSGKVQKVRSRKAGDGDSQVPVSEHEGKAAKSKASQRRNMSKGKSRAASGKFTDPQQRFEPSESESDASQEQGESKISTDEDMTEGDERERARTLRRTGTKVGKNCLVNVELSSDQESETTGGTEEEGPAGEYESHAEDAGHAGAEALDEGGPLASKSRPKSKLTVHFSGVPYKATDAQVIGFLESECRGGKVSALRWPNKANRNCGWGFADFETEAGALAAVEAASKGKEWQGRRVNLRHDAGMSLSR